MTIHNTCLFCKIVSKELPVHLLYEDEHVLSFLDIAPITLGHCLIIPKEHYSNVLNTPKEFGAHLLHAIHIVGSAILQGMNTTGLNVNQNNGSLAGQVIFHTHWHLIPRYNNDTLSLWPANTSVSNTLLEEYASTIKKYIP
ncbi:MAG: HIT family protein [Desulfovibrionaceae bacterium]